MHLKHRQEEVIPIRSKCFTVDTCTCQFWASRGVVNNNKLIGNYGVSLIINSFQYRSDLLLQNYQSSIRSQLRVHE